MLGWSQMQLCEAAKVAKKTLVDFERGGSSPYPRTIAAMQQALEIAGIVFIQPNGGGSGVRMKDPNA